MESSQLACWSQPINKCLSWIHPCCSYDCKMPFNMKKIKVYYLQDPEIIQYPRGHTARFWVEKEDEDLRFCANWGQGWDLGFLRLSLYWQIWNIRAGILKHRKRKQQKPSSKRSVIEINQDLQNKGVSAGAGGPGFSLVLWPPMCLFETALFEVAVWVIKA